MNHELQRIGVLNGVGGEIYGYLFENELTGLQRGLYFNLYIKCEPITYQGDAWEPAILVDWLGPDSILNRSTSSASAPQAEASFYMSGHDWITSWRLDFEHDSDGWPARVSYEMCVDYSGWNDDPLPNLEIRGSSSVNLTWIGVGEDAVSPAPATVDEAKAMIEPYMPRIRDWVQTDRRSTNDSGGRGYWFVRG